MFFIYFLAFFAFIPILAYLLSQNTNNKGYIFGISFLVIIVCLFTVVGKYSFLGSIQKQKVNSEILMNISADKKISEKIKKNFNKNINNEDKVYWLQNYIKKAIKDSKFIARSIKHNIFYATKLKNFLSKYDISSNKISANFLLLNFTKCKLKARYFYEKLKLKGIILRSTEYGYNMKNMLRLTIGSKKENLKFMKEVENIFNK